MRGKNYDENRSSLSSPILIRPTGIPSNLGGCPLGRNIAAHLSSLQVKRKIMHRAGSSSYALMVYNRLSASGADFNNIWYAPEVGAKPGSSSPSCQVLTAARHSLTLTTLSHYGAIDFDNSIFDGKTRTAANQRFKRPQWHNFRTSPPLIRLPPRSNFIRERGNFSPQKHSLLTFCSCWLTQIALTD